MRDDLSRIHEQSVEHQAGEKKRADSKDSITPTIQKLTVDFWRLMQRKIQNYE